MLKAAHLYRMEGAKTMLALSADKLLAMIDAKPAADPVVGQWSKLGFGSHPHFGQEEIEVEVPVELGDVAEGDDEFVSERLELRTVDSSLFQGAGHARALCVEIRERVLPGQVLQQAITERAFKLSERQGHPVSRKQIGQLRDAVTSDMLPKAFIKSSYVMVFIYKDLIIVGTGTPKLADDIIDLMRASTSEPLSLRFLKHVDQAGAFLTRLAVELHLGDDEDPIQEHPFTAGTSALIKHTGRGGGAVRVTDVRMSDSGLVEKLLDGWVVKEMAVEWGDTMTFKMNSGGILKSMKFSDIVVEEINEDLGEDDANHVAAFDTNLFFWTSYLYKLAGDLELMFSAFAPEETPETDLPTSALDYDEEEL